ncbi:hypothetical protein ABWK22_01585 [Gottfriedia acidiceleris]|uniref:hypothetical protein n=1 Tax=Gottfriedia acidiceleris TaxID=371036 RepID=UPI003393FD8F
MVITNDVQFRRGIFNLLRTLKANISDEAFTEIIDNLEEQMEQLPSNDLEQASKFFYEVTNTILKGLEEYFDITHEKITNDAFQGDSFSLKIDEDTSNMIDKFVKYKGMSRFADVFLRQYNYDFYNRFRSRYYNQRIKDLCTVGEDNSLVLLTNKIPVEDEYYLPKDNRGRRMGLDGDSSHFLNIFRAVSSETTYINGLRNDYEILNNAVEEFNLRLQQSLREEHMRFGIMHLKEVLAKIIVPVALIEDERLRRLCIQHNRQIFVKPPTFEDLMYIGSSVHIYSSHDMNDDSSYIAKPIIISETLPTDTEELKYLGVGQYTAFDNESPRSLNGASPYVINNNIYVKASLEDFMELVPEEIREDMEICKNLLESLENPLEAVQVEENETLKDIIDEIKRENTLDPKEVIDNFMGTSTHFVEEEERETGPVFIEEPEPAFVHNTTYSFERTRLGISNELLSVTTQHPNGYVVLGDSKGEFAGVHVNENGEKEIYVSKDLNEIMKALQLKAGLYSIYDFGKREFSRSSAFKSFHHFAG